MSDLAGWLVVMVLTQSSAIVLAAPVNATEAVDGGTVPINARTPSLRIKEKYTSTLLNRTILPGLQTCDSKSQIDQFLCQEYFAAVAALNASNSTSVLTAKDLQTSNVWTNNDSFCIRLAANLPKSTTDHKENPLANEGRCTVFCKYPDPHNPMILRVQDICQYINVVLSALSRTQNTTTNSGIVESISAKDVIGVSGSKNNTPENSATSELLKVSPKADAVKEAVVAKDEKLTSNNTHTEPIKETSTSTKTNQLSNIAHPGNKIHESDTAADVSPPQVQAPVKPNLLPSKAVPVPVIVPTETNILVDDPSLPIGDDNYGPVEQDTIKTHNEDNAEDDDGVGVDNETDAIAEPDQHPGDSVVRDPVSKHINKDPFVVDEESNFFFYFMFFLVLIVAAYVLYHNRRFVLALILEGRRRGGNSDGRRKHTAAYRKLDSNLEEAIASPKSGTTRSQPIIY